jgi:isochorismate hydrolase
MKEQYFQPDTITTKASALRRDCERTPSREMRPIILARPTLLVLDMQRYFLEPGSHAFIPSAEAILPGLRGLVQYFYQHAHPVVFTRHINTAQDAGMMSTWWRDLIEPHNPLSAIIPALDVSQGIVVTKTQYDIFYKTNLAEWLSKQGVTQVIIGGVMTHLCCETSARSAFTHGFEVFFLVDGTATYNEAFHRATLLNLAHGFARLMLVDEIAAVMESNHAG